MNYADLYVWLMPFPHLLRTINLPLWSVDWGIYIAHSIFLYLLLRSMKRACISCLAYLGKKHDSFFLLWELFFNMLGQFTRERKEKGKIAWGFNLSLTLERRLKLSFCQTYLHTSPIPPLSKMIFFNEHLISTGLKGYIQDVHSSIIHNGEKQQSKCLSAGGW